MKKYFFDAVVFVLILLTLPLFLYKLGQTSLVSWDEAWYAEVARNILKTGELINLTWNNRLFTDHPPTGFWIMSLTYKIFGINEFWTRFPSALSGIISMILLYFLGKKLFNPIVGLLASITLSSAIWFIYRSRAGDLDIFLTMFFVLTILLAIKASENKKYLLPLSISLILLFLTKAMVPLVVLPSLVLIFFKNRSFKWRELLFPATLFITVITGWFMTRMFYDPNFINLYVGVGFRGVTLNTTYLANLDLAREYLHSGIGKWFWGCLIASFLSCFLRQKRFFIFIVFFISFMLPITFSPKIQIWHLIPVFPFLLLVYFGFTYTVLEKYLNRFKNQIYAVFIVFNLVIYFNQVKMIWYQFIDIPAFVSDEAILSKEAGRYPQNLIIDGEYIPSTLFYSGKRVVTKAPSKTEDFISLLKNRDEYLLITNKWRLDNPNLTTGDYKILKEDRDKVLILHKIPLN